MEELLLSLQLVLKELDVVDQQYVDSAVELLELIERAAVERSEESRS